MQYKESTVKHCSFCQRNQNEVHKLIVGTEVAICDICFESIKDLLAKDTPRPKIKKAKAKVPSPREIKEHLDNIVIGQDHAKIALSVAVHNHYKRLNNKQSKANVQIQKSNVLVLGPTGSGKTLMVKAIAELLNVPIVVGDATTITQAGYVGDDVESLLSKLIQSAKGDIDLAEHGIVFIDEIDKIARMGDSAIVSRDISGEGVQQALLKMIEGHVMSVPTEPNKKLGMVETIEMDTTHILFVCSGAFVGLDKILESRASGTSGIGFSADVSKKKANLKDVTDRDLVKYGIIPELIGRLPILTTTEALTKDQLVQILTEPKDSLTKQYQELFLPIKLKFENLALEAIAESAIKMGTGARSLRSILDKKLNPLQFHLSQKNMQGVSSVTITKEYVEKDGTQPSVKFRRIKKKGSRNES